MNKQIPYWQMTGFIFTGVMGTLLHFLFDWTGGSVATAPFSAVNESIWEHMKLLFYPMLAFALAEYFAWGKEIPSFWCIKLKGILLGLMLIPVVYYTYTVILGASADWFNIAIFFLAAAMVFRTEVKCFQTECACRIGAKAAVLLLCLIAVVFTVFSFLPPQIPFFQDPQTDTYGF